MFLRCYQKEPNGTFTLVDVARNAKSKTVYVLINGNIETKYLFYVSDDDSRLYDTRKLGGTCTIVPNTYRIYDKKEGKWFSADKIPHDESIRPDNVTPAILTKDEETALLRHDLLLKKDLLKKEILLYRTQSLLLEQKENPSIEEQIKWQYTRHINELLENHFNFSAENIETFLKKHWDTIKGSMLCYTDQRNHPATKFLCALAIALAHHKDKPELALEILMPGLCTESQYSGSFDDLDKLPVDKDEAFIHIKKILATYVTMSIADSQRCYLIPVSIFARNQNHSVKQGEQYRVIHIEDDKHKIQNPYCDTYVSPGDAFLDDLTLKRLALHNEYIVNLCEAKKSYDAIASNQDTLLGQLNQLISHLMHGSAHSGRGEQKVAADSAFLAIHRFNEYYQKINPEQKSGIKKELRDKIDEMLQLASPQYVDGQYVDQTAKMESCVGLQGENLRALVNTNQERLAAITLSGESCERMLQEQKDIYKRSQEALNNPQNQVGAYDVHGRISKKVLDLLKLKPDKLITNDEQLKSFMRLAVSQIEELCQDPKVAQQIVIVINSLENLIVFITGNDTQKIQVVFKYIAAELFNKQIIKLADIDDDQLDQLVHRNAPPHRGIKNLYRLLQPLTALQCRAVFEGLKGELFKILNKLHEPYIVFEIILEQLTSEQRQAVLDSVMDRIGDITKNAWGFNKVLNLLTPEQCKTVYNVLTENPIFYGAIKNGFNLHQVLEYLEPAERTAVYNSIKNRVREIMMWEKNQPFKYFYQALQFLTPAQCKEICDELKDDLNQIIKNAFNFSEVLKNLPLEHRIPVYNGMANRLPKLISLVSDFCYVVEYLTPEQVEAVYNSAKHQFVIWDHADLRAILKFLTPEQCDDVCRSLKDRMGTIIQHAFHFNRLLESLTPEQRTVVYINLEDHIDGMINSAENFGHVLQFLTAQQRSVVCNKVNDRLSTIMKSSSDFRRLFEKLKTGADNTEAYNNTKQLIAGVIHCDGDFSNVLKFLTPEQRTEVFKTVFESGDMKTLRSIIRNSYDYYEVIRFLASEQRKILCNKLFNSKVIKPISEQVYLCQRTSDNDFFIRYEKSRDLCCQKKAIEIQIQMHANHPNAINPRFMHEHPEGAFVVESEGGSGFSDATSLFRYIPVFTSEQSVFAAKSIARQLLAPLHYFEVVHDKNHRNVCPETIFIGKNGCVKLGLFDLIDYYTPDLKIDEAAEKRIRDNPDCYLRNPYIAPECQPKSVQVITEGDIRKRIFSNSKADVWAVGVTMLSTLLGKTFLPRKEFEKEKALFYLIQPALNKENYLESLEELGKKNEPDIQKNIPELIKKLKQAPELAYLIHRCLQSNPEKRVSLAEANALIYLLGGYAKQNDIKDSWETTCDSNVEALINNENNCLWAMDEKKQIRLTDVGRANCNNIKIKLHLKLKKCRRDRKDKNRNEWPQKDEQYNEEAKSTQAVAWKTLGKQATEVRNRLMINSARAGKKEEVERFLASDPDAIKAYFNDETVLMVAVRNNHLALVEMLIEKLKAHFPKKEKGVGLFQGNNHSDEQYKSCIRSRINIHFSDLIKVLKTMGNVPEEKLKTLVFSEALRKEDNPIISLSVLHIAILFRFKDIENKLRETAEMSDDDFDHHCDIKVSKLRDFLNPRQDEEKRCD